VFQVNNGHSIHSGFDDANKVQSTLPDGMLDEESWESDWSFKFADD
jgi:hypothetical protein